MSQAGPRVHLAYRYAAKASMKLSSQASKSFGSARASSLLLRVTDGPSGEHATQVDDAIFNARLDGHEARERDVRGFTVGA